MKFERSSASRVTFVNGKPDVSDLARSITRHVLERGLRDPKDIQRYLRQENLEDEVQQSVAWAYGDI